MHSYYKHLCNFQIYWRRVVYKQHLHSIIHPTLKTPEFSALRDTDTFPPTHTETIVCTRVSLNKLNMDMVFRVGGRSRQGNILFKRAASFIINEQIVGSHTHTEKKKSYKLRNFDSNYSVFVHISVCLIILSGAAASPRNLQKSLQFCIMSESFHYSFCDLLTVRFYLSRNSLKSSKANFFFGFQKYLFLVIDSCKCGADGHPAGGGCSHK